jgi:GNAT superfamily N-acetyltransferase
VTENRALEATVRPATEADLDAVVDVRWEVAAEGRWIGSEVPFDRGKARQLSAELVDAGNEGILLVADTGDLVVGYLFLKVLSYGVAELGMALTDEWRGRGLGRALLDAGVAWARSAGVHKVNLEVWPHNERAVALYRRAGFVVEGRRRAHYPRRNGERWDALIMGLLLQPVAWTPRSVTDDDGWDLVGLVAGCWSEYPGCVLDAHGECPELLAPASAYAAPRGRMWVVDGPGGIVASVALRLPAGGATAKPAHGTRAEGELGPSDASAAASLEKLYVARRWRRHGMARQLVALAEDEAWSCGADSVELWSDTRFADAHRFYEQSGYLVTGQTRNLDDRSHTVERHFAKRLTAG